MRKDTISHQDGILKQVTVGKLTLEYYANEKYILTVQDKSGIGLSQEFTPQQLFDLLSLIQQILQ